MKVELFEPPSGSDLSVVNAARVSFGKRSDWALELCDSEEDAERFAEENKGRVDWNYIYSDTWSGSYPVKYLHEADRNLIKFLARGLTTADWEKFLQETTSAASFGDPALAEKLWEFRRTPEHFVPFAHPHVSFHIEAPFPIARQLFKHKIGMVESEVSRRYVSDKPKFYTPVVWRRKAENVKQGSSDEQLWSYETTDEFGSRVTTTPAIEYAELIELATDKYMEAIKAGMCPEQARFFLPQGAMTEWIWTGSLYGWANVYNKRRPGSHAQRECWLIAEQIGEHMSKFFPVSWEALTNVP